MRKVPVKLTPMTVSHCSSVSSQSRPQPSTPALATTMSSRPNCSTPSATRLLQRGVVANVDLASQHLPAFGLDQADGLARSSGVAGV